jgi:phage terminase large subunit-like protein
MTPAPEWVTSCADWERRLIAGESIIPPPIYSEQAEQALAIFKELRVVDLPKTVWDEDLGEYRSPNFGECSDQWVFDFVAVIFGGYDAEAGKQLIREYGLLISKKNTKSTIAAGIMVTALILCWREEEEHLILAPTKEVADNSFKPAASMIRADEELSDLFHIQDHVRTITHRVNRNSLKVVAADTDTVSGKKSGKVLVDELWLFGKRSNAEAMFMEALGGQVSRDEGWVIYLTTQSDEPPAGVFKERLNYWRDVRDGKIEDRKTLGVLYEFPERLVKSKAYTDPKNFYITNPNIGRSVSAEWLEDQLKKNQSKTDGTLQQFLAKHLNVEIGLNLRSDRWPGADFWEAAKAEFVVTLDELMLRCEVIVFGIDGGGLDDLLGLAAIGRERDTRRWLAWTHAWAHKIVLQRRPEIAPRLLDFQKDGNLTIVEMPGDDVIEVADRICQVKDAGLLPEKQAIGVDASGIGDIVDELTSPERGFEVGPEGQIVAISQGWRLNGAIKTTERKVAGRELVHGGQALMAWCVGNARTVQVGNAVTINKQVSGTAKIDPLMSLFDAVSLMALNPVASGGKSFWEA